MITSQVFTFAIVKEQRLGELTWGMLCDLRVYSALSAVQAFYRRDR